VELGDSRVPGDSSPAAQDRGAVAGDGNAQCATRTTAIRAHYGFNDPEMAVRHFLRGEDIETPEIGQGMVFRYMEEVFVDDIGAASVTDGFTRGEVHAWF
jgi:carbamoyl-phosphate synthase large subunit